MLTRKIYRTAQKKAAKMMTDAGIVMNEQERRQISVADFGLGRLKTEGGQILTFFNTDRISAKAIAMFPNQTLPEHRHPSVKDDPGKEEIIRVIQGKIFLYTQGKDTLNLGKIPASKEDCYLVRHETVMLPGDQVIIPPGTWHWFQADSNGAVVFSFATCVRDLLDEFRDPDIERETKIIE